MNIDWTKPILWDGKPARVLATDFKSPLPVVVAASDTDGSEYIRRCCADGMYWDYQRVTNAPKHVERWLNVSNRPDVLGHSTRARADEEAGSSRIAVVRYVFEGDKLVSAEVVPLKDKP